MFDFLAHWFAKTETIINNNGTKVRSKSTPFSRNHFSWDLTVIAIIAVFIFLFHLRLFLLARKHSMLQKYASVSRTPLNEFRQTHTISPHDVV